MIEEPTGGIQFFVVHDVPGMDVFTLLVVEKKGFMIMAVVWEYQLTVARQALIYMVNSFDTI